MMLGEAIADYWISQMEQIIICVGKMNNTVIIMYKWNRLVGRLGFENGKN
jgi:hypothetical protein